MKDLKISFFTILFIFIGLLLYTKLFGPIPFYVNNITTTKNSLFTVSGTGEVAIIPDTALLTLGVSKNASSVEDAKNQVNTVINQITQDIKKLGVDVKDIKTTNFNINPNYDYASAQQTIRGYSVDANIEVKLSPIDKANNAIDVATKDGATQVTGVQFILNDQSQKNAENQARIEAIKNAKDKAASISQAAGIHLGRIVDVQENPDSFPRPLPMMGALKTADSTAAPPTQLNPGENKINTTVSLSYETY